MLTRGLRTHPTCAEANRPWTNAAEAQQCDGASKPRDRHERFVGWVLNPRVIRPGIDTGSSSGHNQSRFGGPSAALRGTRGTCDT